MIEQILVNGAISGGMLALLALGFTLIYGVAGVANLAHGALFMLGAYAFSAFYLHSGLIPALVLATVFVGLVGSVVYRLIVHPVVEDVLAPLVVTLGAVVIFQQLILIQFGPMHVGVPSFVTGSATILGVTVTQSMLLAFAVSLGLFACVWMFIRRSKIGGAMRAVAQDREVATLMGVNTERVYMLTMAISASLAAVAGILITASTTGVANPYMWMHPLYLSFAIVILGGLGSIKGSLVGGFIVGYAETSFAFLVPGGGFLKGAVALAIMVVVLILRPRGLFGKRVELE